MDVVDLARLQFAVTGNLHFLFVVLTLGLAPLVAIMHTRLAISGNPLYERMTRFWGQIYVINYALGIFTGLVMEFQFGLNWSGLTSYAGDVFGTPLALETLLAFFLESTFLGLWIFGWHRLPRGLHVACIWLVTLTAYASALFIMVANSFLQHPAGAAEEGGRLVLRDFGALFTNPSLVAALPHVLGAGVWAGGSVVMGASAYHLFRRTAEREFFTRSLRIGVLTAFVGSFVTVWFGYTQFEQVQLVQPGKFKGVIPALGISLMMGLGQLVLLVVWAALPLLFRDRLVRWRWTHPVLMVIAPAPFGLVIAGWLTREVGRQPWLVYGKLSVADALTPALTPAAITASFAAFAGVLGLLAVVDWALIIRAVRRGPGEVALGAPDHSADHSPAPAHSF
ncbi:cytochrome ubiquinol oxidase subunit I [Microbispora sp. H10670]|uniref:cytochrome ubiquinol oxidase subunit I n=1 Tax=Microbispora sp. H10670 TaxID=2729108 RepID=UPI001602FD2D|nr:cytochrome ubiquinol oxidase subunit I [Microbispora sp. H10670]